MAAVPTGAAAAASVDADVVTLVTGDVVRLDTYAGGVQRATVVKAADPRGGIHTFTSDGDVYVEPESASALLATGKLDERLFNVSELVRLGYDDGQRATLPLIVSHHGRAGLAARAAPTGSRTHAVLPSIGSLAVTATKSQATSFLSSVASSGDIAKVWLDGKVTAALDESMPQIGAPQAWASGLDGKGVDIAVLDTGVDASHPDLAGRITAAQDFSGSGDTVDRVGHGTHVASIAAGTGAASGGRYRGVAPAANLMIGKVLGDDGSGYESGIIAGMQWAASQGADVVNLSLGGAVTKGDDPVSQAVDEISTEYNTLFVVAAGNKSAGAPGTWDVTSPGAARTALTVGGSRDDYAWSSSRYGLMGDAYIKPDLVAPAFNIMAAGTDGVAYRNMSGTSMAAPHVTGSVALLAQQHPDWGPKQFRAALTSTATPLADVGVYRIGAGRVNVGRATSQKVYVDQGLIDFGYFSRPFDISAMHPVKTLTYTNGSDEPVALRLASTLEYVTVAPGTLTIPPGATAQAEVTLDAEAAPADEYSGRVTATGDDGLEIDSAFGFYKQDDTVDVTFRALDRNGDPGTARLRVAPYLHSDGRYYPDDIYLDPQQTEWTLRLPEGDYNLFGLISTPDASGRWLSQASIVGNPKLSVRAPNFTVTLDARTARPLSLQTPLKSTPRYLTLDWTRGDPGNPIATYDQWYWNQTDGEPTEVSLAPTQRVDDAQFSVATTWDAGVPVLETQLDGRPLSAVFTGGPFIEGTHDYPVVDADANLDKIRGAVALVRERPDASYDEQVQAAADAGAAVVALYSAQDGAFYPYAHGPVPIIALSKVDGDRLRAQAQRRRTQLRFTGTPRTPYAYNLTIVEKQRVGEDVSYRVKPQDLARVDTRVHTSGTGEAGWMLHQGTYTGCDCAPPTVSDYVPATGYTRTEYVTAKPDVVTYTAWQFLEGRDVLYPRDGRTYQPGQRSTQDWLKAPYSPGVANGNNVQMVSRRTGDSIWYSIAGFTDSAGNWSQQMYGQTASSALYLGEKVLYSTPRLLRGTVSVPAEAGTYRLVTDVDHDSSVIGLTTHAHTEWTFGSATPEGDGATVLPLVDIDYTDVTDAFTHRTALDLTNTARRGQSVSLELAVTHQTGSTAPAVNRVDVQVSYDDGATWLPAVTRPAENGTYRATYQHAGQGQYVSLRISASDSGGNAVQQTLTRAYRLR